MGACLVFCWACFGCCVAIYVMVSVVSCAFFFLVLESYLSYLYISPRVSRHVRRGPYLGMLHNNPVQFRKGTSNNHLMIYMYNIYVYVYAYTCEL